MRVTNIAIASIDGQIASFPTQSDEQRHDIGFFHPKDRDLLLQEIAGCDAVIIGAASARPFGGVIDLGGNNQPLWCIVTRGGLKPSEWFFAESRVQKRIFSSVPQPELSQVSGVTVGPQLIEGMEPQQILADLKERGVRSVTLLGGGQINQLFYEHKLVDRLKLTIAPLILSAQHGCGFISGSLKNGVKAQLISSSARQNHLFLEYALSY